VAERDEQRFLYCTNPSCHQLEFTPGAGAFCNACGSQRSTAVAIVPKGGFMGIVDESALGDQDFDLSHERGETYFDPANDPPPVYRPEGRVVEIGIVNAAVARAARMRQLNPRPGSARRLELFADPRVRDIATPHAPPVRCRVRPKTDDEQARASPFHLMHAFTTDIVRIRIGDHGPGKMLRSSERFEREATAHPEREPFLVDCLRRTFAEALVAAGSLLLDIEPFEIGVTFHAHPAQALGKELIFFDTAPGGAGYAQQLAQEIRRVFETASTVLSGCTCGDSCYACLRTYHNQLHHHRLDRRLLEDGLRRFNEENWA
jgi:hypothetical protein